MANYKLTLRYDGAAYHGWQRQKNCITVQQVVERALKKVAKERITVTGCSRTDAGVHAKKFVCNFQSEMTVPCRKMPLAMNRMLPYDVNVTGCEIVDDDFHAQFDTKWKRYVYIVDNGEYKNPFTAKYAYYYPYKLNLTAMRTAASYIVGTHDFAAFMASGSNLKGHTVRTVFSLNVKRRANEVIFTIEADGYLYNMVRIIVGTLLDVGTGKTDRHSLPDIISSADRKRTGFTAAARGLYLTEVEY